MALITYGCPRCGIRVGVTSGASVVGHWCHLNRDRWELLRAATPHTDEA